MLTMYRYGRVIDDDRGKIGFSPESPRVVVE